MGFDDIFAPCVSYLVWSQGKVPEMVEMSWGQASEPTAVVPPEATPVEVQLLNIDQASINDDNHGSTVSITARRLQKDGVILLLLLVTLLLEGNDVQDLIKPVQVLLLEPQNSFCQLFTGFVKGMDDLKVDWI